MAVAIEAMGLSLPYSSSTPAADPLKMDECRRAVKAIRILLERDIKPKDIMTRQAFENAITVVRTNRSVMICVREIVCIDQCSRWINQFCPSFDCYGSCS